MDVYRAIGPKVYPARKVGYSQRVVEQRTWEVRVSVSASECTRNDESIRAGRRGCILSRGRTRGKLTSGALVQQIRRTCQGPSVTRVNVDAMTRLLLLLHSQIVRPLAPCQRLQSIVQPALATTIQCRPLPWPHAALAPSNLQACVGQEHLCAVRPQGTSHPSRTVHW